MVGGPKAGTVVVVHDPASLMSTLLSALSLLSGVLWLTFPFAVVAIARSNRPRTARNAWLVLASVISLILLLALRSAPTTLDLGWTPPLFVLGVVLLPTGAAAAVAIRRARRVPRTAVGLDMLLAWVAFAAALVVGAVIASIPDIVRLLST